MKNAINNPIIFVSFLYQAHLKYYLINSTLIGYHEVWSMDLTVNSLSLSSNTIQGAIICAS